METLKMHETISFYRKQMNLTQEALAQKLGVTNQAVSKWESAQCYPDISLIPQLAEIFKISIDELFGKEPRISGLNSIFSLREDVCRVVVVRGQQIVDIKDLNETINIEYPQHGSGDRQCYKIEVFGSIACEGNICGDVECQGDVQSNIISGDIRCHGNIECNQINGDASNFYGNISCGGNISGNVRCDGNISCGGSISDGVQCGNNLSCAGSINGSVNCGDNVACGDNITGDVTCGGNVECKVIEGNVECHGNIIHK